MDEDSAAPAHPAVTVADLEQRIAVLEHGLQQEAQAAAQLRDELGLLRSAIDQLPYAVYWKDRDLVYRGCNRQFAIDLGLASPAAVVGLTDADLAWQPSEVASFAAIDQRVIASQQPIFDDKETVIHPDGTQEWFETHKLPLYDSSEAVVGVLATYINITARRQAEATVAFQAILLQELSTPIIPISDEVLVMPLIGALDSRRAQQVLETILTRVADEHAQVVILDITGVPIVDTQVAHALIQTGQAVQLLGARLVLTGIRPEVAQALVGLGVDLRDIVTHSTLQHGLNGVLRTQPAMPKQAAQRGSM